MEDLFRKCLRGVTGGGHSKAISAMGWERDRTDSQAM